MRHQDAEELLGLPDPAVDQLLPDPPQLQRQHAVVSVAHDSIEEEREREAERQQRQQLLQQPTHQLLVGVCGERPKPLREEQVQAGVYF